MLNRVLVCVWEQDFTPEDRKQFLKFVWGRTRLPATEGDWGSHTFKITPHHDSDKLSGDVVNNFFPVAHTCFFQLELPRYTTQEAMKVRVVVPPLVFLSKLTRVVVWCCSRV